MSDKTWVLGTSVAFFGALTLLSATFLIADGLEIKTAVEGAVFLLVFVWSAANLLYRRRGRQTARE